MNRVFLSLLLTLVLLLGAGQASAAVATTNTCSVLWSHPSSVTNSSSGVFKTISTLLIFGVPAGKYFQIHWKQGGWLVKATTPPYVLQTRVLEDGNLVALGSANCETMALSHYINCHNTVFTGPLTAGSHSISFHFKSGSPLAVGGYAYSSGGMAIVEY